jgi:hypothetical protein
LKGIINTVLFLNQTIWRREGRRKKKEKEKEKE